MNPKAAVFLDRDGTLIKEVEYLSDPNLVEFLPDVVDGMLRFSKQGLLKIIITNQSAVGRGIITIERLKEIHARLNLLFRDNGVVIDDIYICPHKPDDQCVCRKPSSTMLLRATKEHGIDLNKSVVIGDRLMDIMMGKSVGAKTVLVISKWTSRDGDYLKFGADFICSNLAEAALWVERTLDMERPKFPS